MGHQSLLTGLDVHNVPELLVFVVMYSTINQDILGDPSTRCIHRPYTMVYKLQFIHIHDGSSPSPNLVERLTVENAVSLTYYT